MTDKVLMPIFETAQERTDFIKEHATYFTLTWYSNRKHNTFMYSTIDKARKNGQVAANFINRPVMIYAVWCPEGSDGFGYDSWCETIQPKKNEAKDESKTGRAKSLLEHKAR